MKRKSGNNGKLCTHTHHTRSRTRTPNWTTTTSNKQISFEQTIEGKKRLDDRRKKNGQTDTKSWNKRNSMKQKRESWSWSLSSSMTIHIDNHHHRHCRVNRLIVHISSSYIHILENGTKFIWVCVFFLQLIAMQAIVKAFNYPQKRFKRYTIHVGSIGTYNNRKRTADVAHSSQRQWTCLYVRKNVC